MKKHPCIISNSTICQSYKYRFPYDLIYHTNFKKMNFQAKNLYQCKKCSIIYLRSGNLKKELDNLYFRKKYASLRKNYNIKYKNIGGQKFSKYKDLAEIIKKKTDSSTTKILDIGCYDGSLLKELSKKIKNCQFHGCDIGPNTKKLFIKNCKFKFWDNLTLIKEKFDLITCVNTLQYVPNPKIFIKNIKNLLEKNGKIFFLTLNLSTNPYSITYGDQYYHFTENNLGNLLIGNDLSGKIISNNKSFPRNLISIVKKIKKKKKYRFLKSEKIFYLFQYLKNAENKMAKLKQIENNKNIYIFGSTANSVFVFKSLKKQKIKIDNFIDENPKKINTLFYGKKIISLPRAKKNSILILPYGKTNKNIYLKLKKKYNFNFFRV